MDKTLRLWKEFLKRVNKIYNQILCLIYLHALILFENFTDVLLRVGEIPTIAEWIFQVAFLLMNIR